MYRHPAPRSSSSFQMHVLCPAEDDGTQKGARAMRGSSRARRGGAECGATISQLPLIAGRRGGRTSPTPPCQTTLRGASLGDLDLALSLLLSRCRVMRQRLVASDLRLLHFRTADEIRSALERCVSVAETLHPGRGVGEGYRGARAAESSLPGPLFVSFVAVKTQVSMNGALRPSTHRLS